MKRVFSLLLVLTLVLAAFPVTASAQAAENLQVNTPTFYDSGAVKSVTASFVWGSYSPVDAYLILSTKALEGGKGRDDSLTFGGFGDFANEGNIALIRPKLSSYEDAKAYNDTHDNCFEFVYAKSTGVLEYTKSYTVNMQFNENTIPLGKDDTYYLYLWIKDINDKFYPDNLICVFQVKDGALKWTPATVPAGVVDKEEQNYYRNYYVASAFTELTTGNSHSVTVKSAGKNMTRIESSGAETQNTNGAITPILYNADAGYYFPENYAVATVNGIMVQRESESQIKVCGTPTASVALQLTAAPVKTDSNNSNNTGHNCQPSDWKSDETHHWYYTCVDPNCPILQNTKVSSVSGYSEHVYDNDYDTVCNICDYTRILTEDNKEVRHEDNKEVRPEDKPETGDITNISLWTALLLGGLVLMWVQLEQRKRQYF